MVQYKKMPERMRIQMGTFISNIQIRRADIKETPDAEKIAEILTQGMDISPTSSEADADLAVMVSVCEDSPWITVCSDIINFDLDAQLAGAKRLSEELQTETLAILCLDSDYLALNLIDPMHKKDIWAACGRFPEGKAPRRSNYAAWAGYVADIEAFKGIMRKDYLFTEDCLMALENQLALPVLQAQARDDEPLENAQNYQFYYVVNNKEKNKQPPKFKFSGCAFWHDESSTPSASFLNWGRASKGIGVFITGPGIMNHTIHLRSVKLRCGKAYNQQREILPDLQEKEFQDGVYGLYTECPDIKIPEAIPMNLPSMRIGDLVFQRQITVTMKIACDDLENLPDDCGNLEIALMPLENWEGHEIVTVKRWFPKMYMNRG